MLYLEQEVGGCVQVDVQARGWRPECGEAQTDKAREEGETSIYKCQCDYKLELE
jgi:hypothetical protein